MKLLALDTSSMACSVAACDGEQVEQRHEEQAREHTRLLIPMVRDVLQALTLELRDLDAIVVGNGPGSFIGMRIGASVAQGLAHAAGLTVIPVSSMAAIAAQVMSERDDVRAVAVAQDARMSEVYFGLYGRNAAGLPQELLAERLQTCEEIGELRSLGDRCISAGQGWQRYPKLLAANQQYFHAASKLELPQARYLLTLASLDDAVAPEELEPAYLRHSVADIPQSIQS